MINVVVNKSFGSPANAALVTFSGGPAVAGREHKLTLYYFDGEGPLGTAEWTLIPAGGESAEDAATFFDSQITADPRFEGTLSGAVLSVEPVDPEWTLQVRYQIDGEDVPGSYQPPPTPVPVNVPVSDRSVFVDDAALAARTAEVPDAEWNSGMLGGGGAGPGIGISTENPGLDESLPNWTLLDQFGNARNFQRGQNIGGSGLTDPADYPSSGGEEGTLPASSIRLQSEDQLPTIAEIEAGTRLPGSLELPTNGAALVDLDTGWEGAAAPIP